MFINERGLNKWKQWSSSSKSNLPEGGGMAVSSVAIERGVHAASD